MAGWAKARCLQREPAAVDNRRMSGASVPTTSRSRVLAALDLLGGVLLFAFVAGYAGRHVVHQHDLRSYHTAAVAALRGLDPYDPAVLARVAGRPILPFVYPPVALLPFLAVARLPFHAFATGWMLFQVLLLAGLAVGWARSLASGPRWTMTALLVAFGSNGAAQWALFAGNVAILECALVWAALACFAAERRVAFTLLIVAAASFKLAPAALLPLLLVPTARRRGSVGAFLLATALTLAVTLGPLAIDPFARWSHFWSHLPPGGLGAANPSAAGLARAFVDHLPVPAAETATIARVVWAAIVLGLLVLGAPLFARAIARRDARGWVAIAAFAYVLVLPRPMAYGWLVLGVAPLVLAPRPFHSGVGRFALALILAAQGLWRLTGNESGSPLVVHAPFLLAACVWLLAARDAAAGSRTVRVRAGMPSDHAALLAS